MKLPLALMTAFTQGRNWLQALINKSLSISHITQTMAAFRESLVL